MGRGGALRAGRSPAPRPSAPRAPSRPWRDSVAATVAGLGYQLVDAELVARGLLRVTIDREPGRSYATGPGESVLVEDCEIVTRQLQYALEVDGADYARLEVSSPGLDRPLKTEADLRRFCGQLVALVLKEPFAGRKNWKGRLEPGAEGAGWSLVIEDMKPAQVLGFELHEVREAHLVPVLDFKGRRSPSGAPAAADEGAAKDTEAVKR